MKYTLKDVTVLHDRTGASLSDCKQALEKTTSVEAAFLYIKYYSTAANRKISVEEYIRKNIRW